MMIRGLILGVVLTLIVIVAGVYVGVGSGLMPANADLKPSRLERWMARTSLHATLRREAPTQPNPLPTTNDNLISGIKLYAQNCAVCHGALNGQPSTIAEGLYQHAPQLAKDGVEDDPAGVTYWKVDHGIRLTGMPSFGRTLREKQLWQVTLFLQNMDRLPLTAEREWRLVRNPAPPAHATPQGRLLR
ncbi:MAG: c-type cytochrome [Candidatus Eremiobacteraeota bacterium]|nr:c-type cytochrome [Candidatus Eremiobacteraeota bacterium]